VTGEARLADRIAFAGASTATVLAWYALPDVVRSRTARTAVKTGLLAASAAGAAMIPRVYPGVPTEPPVPTVDLPAPVVAAAAIGIVAAGTAATVWAEKLVFAAGERRRARGARWAHTPVAVALALLTGAAALPDWTRLVPAGDAPRR